MPADKPFLIKQVLPSAMEALAQRRKIIQEIKPGLLADILERIDKEISYSKQRQTSRKNRYLARGRASGLVDAMEVLGVLSEQQSLNWQLYAEGHIRNKEVLVIDPSEEEQREIDDYVTRLPVRRDGDDGDGNDDYEPDASYMPTNPDDDVPF